MPWEQKNEGIHMPCSPIKNQLKIEIDLSKKGVKGIE